MIYLIVGVDHRSLAPWHENVAACDATTAKAVAAAHARARGIDPVVAVAVGPHCRVVDDTAQALAVAPSHAAA